MTERSTFRKFFVGTLAVCLAVVVALTLTAGGCCGLLIKAGQTTQGGR